MSAVIRRMAPSGPSCSSWSLMPSILVIHCVRCTQVAHGDLSVNKISARGSKVILNRTQFSSTRQDWEPIDRRPDGPTQRIKRILVVGKRHCSALFQPPLAHK